MQANDLADEDSDISMLQIVERNLAKQKRNLICKRLQEHGPALSHAISTQFSEIWCLAI